MTVRPLAAFLHLAAAAFAQDAAPDFAQFEARLGPSMAQQFRDRHGTLDIPEARAYLSRILGELTAAQPGDGPCCSVQIHTGGADAPAWPEALPGGYLFVPARGFLSAESEQGFVERIAHAVAHARARDWAIPRDPEVHHPFPISFYIASCDDRLRGPMNMRSRYEPREARAVQAAAGLATTVTLGAGQFERVRALVEAQIGALPSSGPVTAPSLLR
jgi:hypothetical protein